MGGQGADEQRPGQTNRTWLMPDETPASPPRGEPALRRLDSDLRHLFAAHRGDDVAIPGIRRRLKIPHEAAEAGVGVKQDARATLVARSRNARGELADPK